MSQEMNQQAYLHEVSLVKGRRFRNLYRRTDPQADPNEIEEALQDYIESRRMIEKPSEGKRFGAYEAFLTTQ
jgi:hypothetical protein